MGTQTKRKTESELEQMQKGVKLEILNGPMDGMELEIHKDAVILGRDKNCDLFLPLDVSISRQHAKLTLKNGEYYIEDIGSSNGTYIGKKKISESNRIPFEEIFRLGISEMRLIKA